MARLTETLSKILPEAFSQRSLDPAPNHQEMGIFEVLWVKLMLPHFGIAQHKQGPRGDIQPTPVLKHLLAGSAPQRLPTIDKDFDTHAQSFLDLFKISTSDQKKTNFSSMSAVTMGFIRNSITQFDFSSVNTDEQRKIALQALIYVCYKHYNTLQNPGKSQELDSVCEDILLKLIQIPNDIAPWATLTLARIYITQAEKMLGLPTTKLKEQQPALMQKLETIKEHLAIALTKKLPLAYMIRVFYLRNFGHMTPQITVPISDADPILTGSNSFPLYQKTRDILEIVVAKQSSSVPSAAPAIAAAAVAEPAGRKLSELPPSAPQKKEDSVTDDAPKQKIVLPPKEPSFLNAQIPSIPGAARVAPEATARPRPSLTTPAAGAVGLETETTLNEQQEEATTPPWPPSTPAFSQALCETILQQLMTAQNRRDAETARTGLKNLFQRYPIHYIEFLWKANVSMSPREKAMALSEILVNCDFFQPIDSNFILPDKVARWLVNYSTLIMKTMSEPTHSPTDSRDRDAERSHQKILWLKTLVKHIKTTISEPRTAHVFSILPTPATAPDVLVENTF